MTIAPNQTPPWSTSTIGAEFYVQLGKMLDAARNVGQPKPYLGNKSVQWGRIDISAAGVVPMTRADQIRYRLRRGDLLVCEGGDVGRGAIWKDELQECYYQKALHRLRPKASFDPRIMLAFLEYWSTTGVFTNYTTQTSIAHLPRGKFLLMLLPAISLPEQHAIAEALSDADNLIVGLGRLIAKKQAIKQGLMQQLLTGETRLPGCNGDWIERRLVSVLGELQAGVSVNSISDLGQYSVLKTSCVSEGKFDPSQSKTVAPSDISRAKVSPQADSLIISRMNTPALVGEVGYVSTDWPNLFLPDRLWMATKNYAKLVDMRWLGYHLSSPHYSARLKELATGTSGSMKNITRSSFLQLTMPFPPMDEQIAIATVLSDLDLDLAEARNRLTKMQQVKQGMMQKLLTGRTRLPIRMVAIA